MGGNGPGTTSMSGSQFLDTNVLAYVFDSQSPQKSAVAQTILRAGGFVVSGQVLGELYVTLTRKLTNKVPDHVASQVIQSLQAYPVVPITSTLVSDAIQTSIIHQLSYWDSLIIEAAATAGCTTLLTEDLTDGQIIRGVCVTNPF